MDTQKLNLTEEQLDNLKKELILRQVNSAEELRDWIYLFLDIYMPMGHVYHESSSSAVEAMWTIYKAVRDNTGDVEPGYTLLASRDSYKTISASMLEIILMIHFRTTIAHCAAIESQSQKSVEYCSTFLSKLMPYLEYHGWKRLSMNKRKIELQTDKGELCYIQIIILTMRGANCISPNTSIHYIDGSFKKASEVKKGDKIKTWDYFNNKDIEVEVGDIEYTNKPSREVVFKDGSNLVLSDDHMVFTNRGWICAANLRLNNKLKPTPTEKIHSTGYKKVELSPFSRDLNQLILGTGIGDAYIGKIPSGKCRYSVFHCEAQLPYLEEIKKVFDLNNIDCTIRKARQGYVLQTKTHPIFEKYHKLLYKDRKKIVSNVLPLLNDEGLAYWFMDDGSGNFKKVSKRKDSALKLATCGFAESENIAVVNFLKNRGYECKVIRQGNQIKTYPIVKLSLESSRDLCDKMEIYFVNCLKYKLLPSNDFNNTTRTVDGNVFLKYNVGISGFVWTDRSRMSSSKGRKDRTRIKKHLTQEIEKINILGRQNLIDLKIKSNIPYLHSFYANNVLTHNSAHVNILSIDELDLCDPKAYQEAKMIPGVYKGRFPISIRLSTRKFSFGLMQKELDNAKNTGEKILRWNILDVAAHCPASRCLPDKPTTERYIPRELPLIQLSPTEFAQLDEKDQNNWEKIDAYEGCLKCPLLSVCKKVLHDKKPKECTGDLWKPIDAVINVIRQVDPDVGEAQLLCHKPSSKGLIYPRFTVLNNTLTVQEAWQKISGLTNHCNLNMLIQYIKDLGVRIEGGIDWGYTNEFSVTVAAIMPGGHSFILHGFAAPGLELDDCVKICLEIKEKFGVQKWWADQAYPAYIKTFNRKGLKCPKFDKDVPIGIEAVRGRIVDANNSNWMWALDIEENQRLIKGFSTYHWKIDAQGNPTDKPDHTEESDIMDGVRYLYQNAYGSKKGVIFDSTSANSDKANSNKNSERMMAKVNELAIKDSPNISKKKKGRIFWG